MESRRLLQRQEEEEERLQNAGQAGTPRTAQDVDIQVGEKAGAAGGSGQAGSVWPARTSPAAVTDLAHTELDTHVFGRRRVSGRG